MEVMLTPPPAFNRGVRYKWILRKFSSGHGWCVVEEGEERTPLEAFEKASATFMMQK